MSKTSKVRGSIPEIIRNDADLYEGNLEDYFRSVFHHAGNLFNPYHNFRHMFHVLWLCYQACVFYAPKHAMTKREMRNLLIAALFHDFDHAGKAGPDSVNIKKAVSGLLRYIMPEDKEEYSRIAAI